MKKVTAYSTILFLSLSICGSLFGGVRQNTIRNSNTTNIGTNPYKDMETGYATVNPNYANGATVYPAADGAVAPRVVNGGYGTVVASNSYYNYDAWAASATPGSLLPIGTILEYYPSHAVPLMVKGSRYYYTDNTYLAEVFDGSAVVYQVVPAPVGAIVSMLPAGCVVQTYNGKSLTVCGGTTYQQVAGGFEVVGSN